MSVAFLTAIYSRPVEDYSWSISLASGVKKYFPESTLYVVDNNNFNPEKSDLSSIGNVKIIGTHIGSHANSIIHGIDYLLSKGIERAVLLDQDCIIYGDSWLKDLNRSIDHGSIIAGQPVSPYILYSLTEKSKNIQDREEHIHLMNTDMSRLIADPWKRAGKLKERLVAKPYWAPHPSTCLIDIKSLESEIPRWRTMVPPYAVEVSKEKRILEALSFCDLNERGYMEFDVMSYDVMMRLSAELLARGKASRHYMKEDGIYHAWFSRILTAEQWINEDPQCTEFLRDAYRSLRQIAWNSPIDRKRQKVQQIKKGSSRASLIGPRPPIG